MTAIKTAILGLVLSTACFSTISYGAPEIVGGSAVDSTDAIARSTVAIYLQTANGRGAICTGSLLSSNTVVTAAHCVRDVKAAVVIFARDVTRFERVAKSQIRQVVAAQANPNFDLKLGEDVNDIAIIQFSGGIPAGYSPATLMDKKSTDAALVAGAKVIIAGYGITGMEAQDSSGLLRKTVMMVRSQSAGKAEVLLTNPGHSACEGDSGGPAFVVNGGKLFLWGVTSRGDKNCTLSIYTKIQAYLSTRNASY